MKRRRRALVAATVAVLLGMLAATGAVSGADHLDALPPQAVQAPPTSACWQGTQVPHAGRNNSASAPETDLNLEPDYAGHIDHLGFAYHTQTEGFINVFNLWLRWYQLTPDGRLYRGCPIGAIPAQYRIDGGFSFYGPRVDVQAIDHSPPDAEFPQGGRWVVYVARVAGPTDIAYFGVDRKYCRVPAATNVSQVLDYGFMSDFRVSCHGLGVNRLDMLTPSSGPSSPPESLAPPEGSVESPELTSQAALDHLVDEFGAAAAAS